MLIYYTINSVNSSNFGYLFCRLFDFGDVLAGATEGSTRAGTGPAAIHQAYGILIALRTLDCPILALRLFFLLDPDLQVKLPWVLLDFDELAASPVDSAGI